MPQQSGKGIVITMKYINQLMIILGISFAGELMNHFLPFPLPASVYGLILLFLCLLTGIVKLHQVEDTAQYLIAVMPIFFIEPSVGLMESLGLVGNSILTIFLAALLSTIVTFAATGWGAQVLIRFRNRRQIAGVGGTVRGTTEESNRKESNEKEAAR